MEGGGGGGRTGEGLELPSFISQEYLLKFITVPPATKF